MIFLFAADDPAAPSRLRELITLWPMWLPLVLGGAAVYALLPRPKPLPVWPAALAGLAAVIAAGVLLIGVPSYQPEPVLFYAFSALAVVGGGLLVTQANPARAALAFVLVVLSTTGLFLLLAAPFLMAATIVVYAGAIIVTFLFVIMLAQQEGPSDADQRSREPVLVTVTGFVLLFAMLYVLRGYSNNKPLDDLIAQANEALAAPTFDAMTDVIDREAPDPSKDLFGRAVTLLRDRERRSDLSDAVLNASNSTDRPDRVDPGDEADKVSRLRRVLGKLQGALVSAKSVAAPPLSVPRTGPLSEEALPLSGLSGTPANTPPGEVRRDPVTHAPAMPADNSAMLGRSLFTDYLLAVELGGLLLLVATVGAIAISQRRGEEATRLAGVHTGNGRPTPSAGGKAL